MINDKYFWKDYYDDFVDAKHAVRKGKAWAIIEFSSDFTQSLKNRSDLSIGSDGDEMLKILKDSEIRVWLDQSSKYHSESTLK